MIAVIRTRDLWKDYGDVETLHGLDLDVEQRVLRFRDEQCWDADSYRRLKLLKIRRQPCDTDIAESAALRFLR